MLRSVGIMPRKTPGSHGHKMDDREPKIGFDYLPDDYETPPLKLELLTGAEMDSLMQSMIEQVPEFSEKVRCEVERGRKKAVLKTAEKENRKKLPDIFKPVPPEKKDDPESKELKFNPYRGRMDDRIVAELGKKFHGVYNLNAVEAGMPDRCAWECVLFYLTRTGNMSIKTVQGDGNCLPNAILAGINFHEDKIPEKKGMFGSLYLRRAVIRHLILNWDELKEQIIHDVKNTYGRIDSKMNGEPLLKRVKVGKKYEDEWGYSVAQWCNEMIKDGVWCNAIFIKLVASMWGCRIGVIRSDTLGPVTYRYEPGQVMNKMEKADIVILFNGNPLCGHYSGIMKCCKDLQFESMESGDLSFTSNYRKSDDLDERLRRDAYIWDLDREDEIFTKKRGYMFVDEDRKSKGTQKLGKTIILADDEMVVKKKEWIQMENKLDALEAEIDDLKGGGGDSEKMERNMNILKAGLVKLKKQIIAVSKGKDLEEDIEPEKEKDDDDDTMKRKAQDKPPEEGMGRLFKAKRVQGPKEIKQSVLKKNMYKPGDTRCKICDEDLGSPGALVSHFARSHKNDYLYYCEHPGCGKGFMSVLGYRLHMAGHKKTGRLPCEDPNCKDFGSKSAVKKHMREQHPTEEQKKKLKVKCRFCSKVYHTLPNCKDHEYGCEKNPDRKPIFCEICSHGPFYLTKRVMDHKRAMHRFT